MNKCLTLHLCPFKILTNLSKFIKNMQKPFNIDTTGVIDHY